MYDLFQTMEAKYEGKNNETTDVEDWWNRTWEKVHEHHQDFPTLTLLQDHIYLSN